MYNLSSHVIDDIENLYSSVNSKNTEDEILEDICEVVLASLIYKGKTANYAYDYLNNASMDDIIQIYENFDEKIITESVIEEDFINQQYEIIESGGFFKKVGSNILNKVGIGKIGKWFNDQVLRRSGKVRPPFKPKKPRPPFTPKTTSTTKPKTPIKVPNQKPKGNKLGTAAIVTGAATGAIIGSGIANHLLKGNDSKDSSTENTPGSSASRNKDGSTFTRTSKNEKGLTPEQQWAKNFPDLATARDEKKRIRGTSQSDNPLITKGMRSRMPSGAPTVQSPKVQKLGKGHQSLKNNPYAGKSSEDKKVKKESFDSYDIVINYLLEMGHVNSIDEANYVIMGMDKETLHKIVND